MYPFHNVDYLRHVPNYTRAHDVDSLDVGALDRDTFLHEFVNRNRPVLVRGAARHWAAHAKWSSDDYLKATCGSAKVRVFHAPRLEGDATIYSAEKKRAIRQMPNSSTVMTFAEFVDQSSSGSEDLPELFFLYSVRTGQGSPLEALRKDIGAYTFLTKPHRTALNIYPEHSIYLYRSSITDWHYHATAEALQTQIVGTKEVILLPPSDAVWSYMREVQASRIHSYDAAWAAFAWAPRIVPFRAVLCAGDALYIPNYWWHLVSTKGHRSLGATVPTWWDSPLHVQMDLRYPAARQSVRSVLSGALPWRKTCLWLPAVAGGIAWSAARRVMRPRDAPWFLSHQNVLPLPAAAETA